MALHSRGNSLLSEEVTHKLGENICKSCMRQGGNIQSTYVEQCKWKEASNPIENKQKINSILFIHSSVDGHFDYFHYLATESSAAVIVGIKFFCVYVFYFLLRTYLGMQFLNCLLKVFFFYFLGNTISWENFPTLCFYRICILSYDKSELCTLSLVLLSIFHPGWLS